MPTRISVAMATYNGEKYLREQLDSLAKQTALPYELVVCDDGSKDGTVQIIREFAATAPFPVNIHINETNLGYSDNFLKAARLCQGDWIAFCDQDDVWMPRKFERVTQTIRSQADHELMLIGHTSLVANDRLEPTGQRLPNFQRDSRDKRASNFGYFCIVGFSMIFRNKLINEIDATLRPRIHRENASVPPGHDQWIGLLANALGDMAFISEPLAIWRRHENSLTRPPGPMKWMGEVRIAKTALTPEPYILLGNMAKETAECLKNIADNVPISITKRRLHVASKSFSKLANNAFLRGNLYAQQSRMSKIWVFAKLLKTNAYTGPKISSLGWKSLLKDIAFTVGAIH
ncbi:glycosyltransferase [Hydrogenophaga sp.]|uniref:glycosyltransferase n=1 Tax=Hydrogenophaga sp. TaxID=1904254 RepID=UPI00286E82B1|nr:glycosyltransferase [Hydrogenophaga sp.]